MGGHAGTAEAPAAMALKFPRALGEALRDLEWLRQERAAIIEDWAALKARVEARRYGASLTRTNALLAEIEPPKAGA